MIAESTVFGKRMREDRRRGEAGEDLVFIGTREDLPYNVEEDHIYYDISILARNAKATHKQPQVGS